MSGSHVWCDSVMPCTSTTTGPAPVASYEIVAPSGAVTLGTAARYRSVDGESPAPARNDPSRGGGI